MLFNNKIITQSSNIIVQKFGGTSLANIELIEQVANSISKRYKKDKIIVVVSAMYGATSRLISQCLDIQEDICTEAMDEMNVVISTGEVISSGLLALALKKIGINAESVQGWQIPIITHDSPFNSRIISIGTKHLLNLVNSNIIPIVCGFQGINKVNRVTTLGRGGSDTTAIAIAAAIKAKQCEIYTDVKGVYTADPRILPNANRINTINYNCMLEMSLWGSKVLDSRAASIASRYQVPLLIGKSDEQKEYTIVNNKKYMETPQVTAITSKNDFTRIIVSNLKSEVRLQDILEKIKENNIITHSAKYSHKECEFIFDVPIIQENQVKNLLNNFLINETYQTNPDITHISVVGYNLDTDVMSKILSVLQKFNITQYSLYSTSNRITICTNHVTIASMINELHKELIENKNKH